MLVFITLACTEYVFNVAQENNTAKNANIVFSQTGFIRYAESNIVKAFESLVGKPLNDLNFEVVGLQIMMKNIMITKLDNPKMNVIIMEESQQAETTIRDFGLELSFEFHLLHQTPIFFEDKGTGKLQMAVDNINLFAWVNQSAECPGAFYINATHSSAKLDHIRIRFESNLSYIYNALLPFVTDFLCSYLNEELSDTIVEALLQIGNEQLIDLTPLGHYFSRGTLSSDQRWIGNIEMLDRQFRVSVSGAACLRDEIAHTCTGVQAYDSPPRCNYAINADVTYEVSSNVFNQLLAYLWQLNSSYLAETFNVTQISVAVKRVVNTGVVVEIQYEKDGATNTIEALAHAFSEPRQWESSSVVLAYFGLKIYKVTDPGSLDLSEATQFALNLNYILKEYGYTILNGYDLEFTNARIVYCDANWIFFGVQVNSYAS